MHWSSLNVTNTLLPSFSGLRFFCNQPCQSHVRVMQMGISWNSTCAAHYTCEFSAQRPRLRPNEEKCMALGGTKDGVRLQAQASQLGNQSRANSTCIRTRLKVHIRLCCQCAYIYIYIIHIHECIFEDLQLNRFAECRCVSFPLT